MLSPLALVFWLWLAVSLALLARRRWGSSGSNAGSRSGPTTSAGNAGTDQQDEETLVDVGPDVSADELISMASTAPPRDAAPAPGVHAVDPAQPPAAVSPLEHRPATPRAVIGSLGPTDGRPLPTGISVSELAGPQSTATSVAEALAGIQMPCGLVPLTMVETHRLDAAKVAFTTSGHPADVVGRELADELERLGYALTPIGDQELVAEREDNRLRVHIHPNPSLVSAGGGPAFPTVAVDAVVVETELR